MDNVEYFIGTENDVPGVFRRHVSTQRILDGGRLLLAMAADAGASLKNVFTVKDREQACPVDVYVKFGAHAVLRIRLASLSMTTSYATQENVRMPTFDGE